MVSVDSTVNTDKYSNKNIFCQLFTFSSEVHNISGGHFSFIFMNDVFRMNLQVVPAALQTPVSRGAGNIVLRIILK